jgi:hypothetical protein
MSIMRPALLQLLSMLGPGVAELLQKLSEVVHTARSSCSWWLPNPAQQRVSCYLLLLMTREAGKPVLNVLLPLVATCPVTVAGLARQHAPIL